MKEDGTCEEDNIFTSLQALIERPFELWYVSPNFPRIFHSPLTQQFLARRVVQESHMTFRG